MVQATATAGLRNSDGDLILRNAERMLRDGRETFRFDTFGDEQHWSGKLKLHEAVAGAANGGVGPGLSPQGAFDVGLKVDMDVLPQDSRPIGLRTDVIGRRRQRALGAIRKAASTTTAASPRWSRWSATTTSI
jgi:hypothetical protein